jgi:L-2-hydroxycarboxylate dehydrogenase (NAD+)
MKIALADIKEKMTTALAAKGFNAADIPFLVDMYLGGELRGHTSHGLASFAGFVNDDFSKCEKPVVLKETNALFMIDAKSNPGAIIGKRAADEAIKRAKREVIGIALIKNMDSWLRPGAIAQYIAEAGYFAIVINDGGGSSVAPPGGYDPVLATNPIAYGIPTEGAPLVVDMASSKRAWGQVRLANKYGTDLPADTFYNKKGEFTLDPKEAHSVMAVGDYKGFALALLVEVLCGSLLGMDMMIDTKSMGSTFGVRLHERGAFILVIDSNQTDNEQTFKHANSDLIERIKATHPLKDRQIRVPGEEAGHKQAEAEKEGYIDIPETLWDEIKGL